MRVTLADKFIKDKNIYITYLPYQNVQCIILFATLIDMQISLLSKFGTIVQPLKERVYPSKNNPDLILLCFKALLLH